MTLSKALFSSETDLWATPQDLFDKLDDEFHFDIDVCATEENHKTPNWLGYFKYAVTGEQGFTDGLAHTWTGTCWMNPPYNKPEQPCRKNCKKKKCKDRGYHIDKYIPGSIDWIRKAYESCQNGATVVCLLPVRSDTEAFHNYIIESDEIRFIEGRLSFGDGDGKAPFPSMIVVFRDKPIYNLSKDSPHLTSYKLK